MTAYGIRLVALQGIHFPGSGQPQPGDWLQEWDVEFAGGRGMAVWTDDVRKAHRFLSHEDALKAYRQQSRIAPTRPWDGRPNRPLTAYTVSVEPLEATS